MSTDAPDLFGTDAPALPQDRLSMALLLAGRGWPVFPLHSVHEGRCTCSKPDCQHQGKHPRIDGGFKNATTDEAQIRRWARQWPDANWGLATGPASGLTVIDVDTKNHGEVAFSQWEQEHGPLPRTIRVNTGSGGWHLYFQHPGVKVTSNSSKAAPGIDVKADGGYVVTAASFHASGRCYGFAAGLGPGEAEVAPLPAWLLEQIKAAEGANGKARAATPSPTGNTVLLEGATRYAAKCKAVAEGGRNEAAMSLAGHLRAFVVAGTNERLGEREILTIAQTWNLRNAPPLPDQELAEAVRSGIVNGTPRPDKAVELPAPAPPEPETPEPALPGHRNCTDLGNAERFFDRWGREVRYCKAMRQWFLWDDRRWAPDATHRVMGLAKGVVRGLHAEAAACAEDAVRQALSKHAYASEGVKRQNAMMEAASWDQRTAVKPADLDAWPLRLNVVNGTLDLETGKLRPHDRAELHTKLAPVIHKPEAQSDLWDYFLFWATGGDPEYQAFLQRVAGYCLTGLTTEEKLFFIHGPKQSGKSTFLEALKATLGSYARTADFETFLARGKGGNGPRDDIAELAGARLVASCEVEQGRRLAEGLVKQLTGGDTGRARMMYRDGFEFKPQFKLLLVANHAPRCDADDAALFRRVLRLPFEHSVGEDKKDPRVKQMLTDPGESGPAILAWAVQGCLEWQQIGLAPPASVVAATEAYRVDQDPLADFIADCCVVDPSVSCRSSDLMQEYERWAKANGVSRTISYKSMAERLRGRGMLPDELGPERFRGWKGIGIKNASRYAAMF